MENVIQLPEITARAYAKINGLAPDTVSLMCSTQLLPARKMSSKGVCVDNAERGQWWINLVQLAEQLK